jgi:hypothetical protein
MIKKILIWSQGRSTLFASFFALAGTTLAWYNRLTPTYVALVTAIQGYVVVHSIKEDYFKKDDKTLDKG